MTRGIPLDQAYQISDGDIAVVGMALHVPGARTVSEFWRNLRDGVESTRSFSDEELLAAGVSEDLLADPHYVRSGAVLDELEWFDAEFFGFSPKEAAILDPQHRLFLECAWEALEDAGHPPESFPGSIGVFAGCGMNAYFIYNLLTNPELVDSVGMFLLRHTGNDKDFLATRFSYLFDLKGPSISVQTACSTSLVAAHMAAQSLMCGECDMALAGGVTIEIPHRQGYLYQKGEILSPDGHCRAFDHRSQGTIFGSGAGVVVLRRLGDAIENGDRIYAVWKGSAVNNDGSGKVGYLAPSVDGQAAAVAEALSVSDVDASTIGYVECHGTGTPVGDPIEVAALTNAFRQTSDGVGFCGIGSVKTNIGHLDTAAGAAGLIKACLAVRNGQIPPTLNYEAPNPTLELKSSPFYVNDRLRDWPAELSPRRACINSLGVGGTNAFAIVEQPPTPMATTASKRPFQLLLLSARNRAALDENCKRLAAHLKDHPDQILADVAYTLCVGRRAFDQRRVLACRDRDEAIRLLEGNDPRRVFTHKVLSRSPSIVFMFPGGGAQYPRMGKELYDTQPVFREHVDRGLNLLQPRVDFDVRRILFPDDDRLAEATTMLERPSVQLPPIFILEYALAQLWISWGVLPDALIGHSLGENTAACVSGVLTFEDALGLVTLRGKLFERIPPGGMLSVQLPAEQLRPYLGDDLDLATVNSPTSCVASGSALALDALQRTLAEHNIDTKRVPISIAAHSRLLEPILDDFGAYLKSIKLAEPRIPFISNRTGTWIAPEEATDPDYWVRHLRHTIHFADGIGTLLKSPGRIFLEVGPGKTLCSLAKQHPDMKPGQGVISSMRHPEEKVSDAAYFLTSFGQLWAAGAAVNTEVLWKDEKRRRVSLPTYAFQRQRYWIEPGKFLARKTDETKPLRKLSKIEDWGYRPKWNLTPVAPPETLQETDAWLIFLDDVGIGKRVVDRLRRTGHEVITVREADAYQKTSGTDYFLSPELGREGYDSLIRDLAAEGKNPTRIIHLWSVTGDEKFRPGSSFFHRNMERGFYSLLFLAQAMGEEGWKGSRHLTVATNGMQRVTDEEVSYPEKAAILGPVKVIPREFPGFTCSCIDVELPHHNGRLRKWGKRFHSILEGLSDRLHAEIMTKPRNSIVALRESARWDLTYEKSNLIEPSDGTSVNLRDNGVYLVTGGLGGIGLTIAEHLASSAQARLVLVGRSSIPDRSEWDTWLRMHSADDVTSRKIRRVREMESRGAKVLVAPADVTDVEDMRRVISRTTESYGPINGLIHAAGVLRDGLIQVKSQSDIEEVFSPKIHGTLVLDSLLCDQSLDFFVVFSSTSSILAPVGQVDYVAANAFLNAFADFRSKRRSGRTIAINWGVWKDVGMAAEASARMAGDSTPESLSAHSTTHPLFESRNTDGRGKHTMFARYNPQSLWLLNEHRTRAGHALMPGTGFLELARAALVECGETRPFEIADLFFFRPLTIGDDESRDVRVKLAQNDSGYALEVQSRCTLDDGRVGWERHVQAALMLGEIPPADKLDPESIEARCLVRRLPDNPEGIRSPQEDHLRFGPRWRVLRRVSYGEGEAVARLELRQEFLADLENYRLHPALLDFATGYAMDLIEGYGLTHELWVPVSYRCARVRAPLARKIWSWVRNHGRNRADAEFALFDITICDDAGHVLVDIEEFAIKRVTGDVDFAIARRPTAAEVELEKEPTQDGHRPSSSAESAFHHILRMGIQPAEGVEAFRRVLADERSTQIVVSSLDLDSLLRQADTAAAPTIASAKFERPKLDTEYVEPRNAIEKTLVGFWEELLGVDRIGIRDSFFDLGGHSLVAVRLFAKVKKTFNVEYPISVLFEAPTIEHCSALIRESIGEFGAQQAATPSTSHRPRFTHLVPMHAGEGAPRTPFFLVAGMFGNVLNLRHLAHLISPQRPFYGVQARGLLGDDKPHETFEEMAADYLTEIRTVQPQGPYLLGGFSGGGIAAFEMAHRLRAEGHEVALLVLLDTPLPQSPALTRRDKAIIHWQRFQREGPAYFTRWAARRLAWEWAILQQRLHPSADAQGPAEFRSEAIKNAFYASLPKYRLQYYPGTITLFRPKLDEAHVLGPGRVVNIQREFVYPDNGWGPYADQVEQFEVPGDHDSMVLEPYVRVLAQKLRACLETVDSRNRRLMPRPSSPYYATPSKSPVRVGG